MNVEASSRSRSFALAWTNSPIQTRGGLGFPVLGMDDICIQGTARQVLEEYYLAVKANQGNDWGVALFFGGRRVRTMDIGTTLRQICDNHQGDLQVEDAL